MNYRNNDSFYKPFIFSAPNNTKDLSAAIK